MTRDATPVAIVGPTATGKTAVAIEVAKRIGGEIISMDSRQVYRGMDIGTAKPGAAEQGGIEHHGLDLVDPDKRFNAGRFAEYARRTMAEIVERGRTPLLVGGTGFFLRALTHPIFQEPQLEPARRERLEELLGRYENEELRRWLRELDPTSAERLSHWGGRQRLLRALELPLLTGRSLTWWQQHSPSEHEPLRPRVFVMDLPQPALDQRIEQRIDAMVRQGLVAEVASLIQQGFDDTAPGMNATGYIEVIPHLRGECTLDEAIQRVRRNTRAYARRQRTWFRRQLPPGAAWLDAGIPTGELADAIVAALSGEPQKS